MRVLGRTFVLCIISMCFLFSAAGAETLYEEDFEGGKMVIGEPNPVWQVMGEVAGRVDPGNLFEVVKGGSHSGSYCLRFNYDGRNGICNTCGGTNRYMKNGYNDVNYFVDKEGADLTKDPIKAVPGRIVYNITDGFSMWQITALQNQDGTNDKLLLSKIANGIGNAENYFDAGDHIKICRECGVDGTIGGDKNRKSDCDIAISYLQRAGQQRGQSLFRRVYIKIGKGTLLPYHQKLRYWSTSSGNSYLNVRNQPDTGHIREIFVHGDNDIVHFQFTGVSLDFDTWYYIEEEFKAESYDGASDGEYRLWIAKDGEDPGDPIIDQKGLHLGTIRYAGASLWGNHQHWNDCKGYWYIDDIKIATSRIGPVQQDQHIPSRPENLKIIKEN